MIHLVLEMGLENFPNAANQNEVFVFLNKCIDSFRIYFYLNYMCKIVNHFSVYYYGPLT
jgi:hypothetical protein